MPAVPAELEVAFTVQDATGDVSVVRVPSSFGDLSISTITLAQAYGYWSTLNPLIAACINGKVVLGGLHFRFQRAQKPNGPLSTYALVQDRVKINFGDGGTERMNMILPTPITGILKADGQTFDPTSAAGGPLVAGVEAFSQARSGAFFNEYLGGRLVSGKTRRRKNLYNGIA